MGTAAEVGRETETAVMKVRKAGVGEDDMVETALAAAAAALFVSGMKTLLQCVLGGQWPGFLLGPSPFLFLLLQLVIASIVFVSTHPASTKLPAVAGRRKATRCSTSRKDLAGMRCATAASQGKRRQQQHQQRACRRRRERGLDEGEGTKDQEWADGGCAADELNARAEAFISAFRQHLKLDSISSSEPRCGRRVASFRY